MIVSFFNLAGTGVFTDVSASPPKHKEAASGTLKAHLKRVLESSSVGHWSMINS